MPYYNPPIIPQPHNFNSTVVTINSPDLDGSFTVEGLDTLEVELADDRWSSQDVNSGMTCHVHNPRKKGTIKFTLMDASPSMGLLSQLARADSPVTVTVTDENAPELNASSPQARVMKHAVIKRSGEIDTPEWTFVCTYLTCESGGYRLQTTA